MRVQVTLVSRNLDTGEEKVIADSPALLNENRLRYEEKEEHAIHDVLFEENHVVLKRKADVTSTTELFLEDSGTSLVESPWGIMNLSSETETITRDKDRWIVEYSIYSGNERVLHQRLEWKIRYFS
ncbi:MAG: DUF1934 family protein [Erysipelotrichaceae bacterium]|nr:DUF1934 family protein [Erysipelotrichaceae bacterium]